MFTDRLKEDLGDAMFSNKLAKAGKSARSSIKYKLHSYKPGGKVWLSKSLFKDAYSKPKDPDKLSARRIGPYEILDLIGRNALRFEFPCNVKIHDVENVMHTVPYSEQPLEIALSLSPRPDSVSTTNALIMSWTRF